MDRFIISDFTVLLEKFKPGPKLISSSMYKAAPGEVPSEARIIKFELSFCTNEIADR